MKTRLETLIDILWDFVTKISNEKSNFHIENPICLKRQVILDKFKETYRTAIEDCLKCLPKELSREKHLRNIKEKNIFWCDGHNSCLSLTKENLTKLKSNLKEDK